jgi:predicted GNAT family acetyltransferase
MIGRMTSSDPTSQSAVVHRIMAFERTLADRFATHVQMLPFGTARICPDLPHVYDASGVEVTRPVPDDELLRVTESVFADAGLRHRRVHTAMFEIALSIGSTLTSQGWSSDRWVYMAHDRRVSAPVPPQGYSVVDIDRWEPAARAFEVDVDPGRDPAGLADTAARDRRLAERIDVRFVLTDDGSAGCHVYRLGSAAQIENIYVLRRARGSGRGRTVLAGALHEVRDADLVFLVADAGGWQRHWYERAGFAVVARGWNWLRRPAEGC